MDAAWLRGLFGKRVRITLMCGTYSGRMQQVDTATNCIILDQVEYLDHKLKLPGVRIFYGYEIKNVEILDALSTASDIKQTNNNDEKGKLKDTAPGEALGEKHFPDLEYEHLEHDLEIIVINQFHQKFGPAISTNDRIYLFDIFLLGAAAFKNGLKIVLEDINVLKVIHDSRLLSDCLYHQYRVDLTNVFDTQVADVLQFSTETGGLLPSCVSTLEECLICHLGLPPPKIQFLQHSAAVLKVDPKVWSSRPLPPHLMKSAALEVMFLLRLRSTLMDKLMMDFTTQVDNYLSMYRNMPSITLGGAETTSLELPYELKELALIQRLRREDALKIYKTDENGCLVRPCPQFKNKSKVEGRIINRDDIPELEMSKAPKEDLNEMQNEEIPLLEPIPSCGGNICCPLE
ncbi:piRNA biogenesis protein EXD1 isoform X3 [Hypanus sabinus]|uniref:piRNA biogenesis protein EXD1 isoform X3 n=1 Tax=Hypanus sabinus TaxID=79690 RepID=UPI0028C50D99|nr:piRNA biogenesis protein EXD1 isoform X3 [Hypanus sabinus]